MLRYGIAKGEPSGSLLLRVDHFIHWNAGALPQIQLAPGDSIWLQGHFALDIIEVFFQQTQYCGAKLYWSPKRQVEFETFPSLAALRDFYEAQQSYSQIGRPSVLPRSVLEEAQRRRAQGMPITRIAEELRVSRAALYRFFAKKKR